MAKLTRPEKMPNESFAAWLKRCGNLALDIEDSAVCTMQQRGSLIQIKQCPRCGAKELQPVDMRAARIDSFQCYNCEAEWSPATRYGQSNRPPKRQVLSHSDTLLWEEWDEQRIMTDPNEVNPLEKRRGKEQPTSPPIWWRRMQSNSQ